MRWKLDNYKQLSDFLGERPGNKIVDPGMVKRGWGNKVYFWDNGKWYLVHPNDNFYRRSDGTIVQERA